MRVLHLSNLFCPNRCSPALSSEESLIHQFETHGYAIIACNPCASCRSYCLNYNSRLLEAVDPVFQPCQTFFEQSLDTKMLACSKDRARRGYSPLANDNFASLIGISGKPNDTVEKFRIGPEGYHTEQDVVSLSSKAARVHYFPNDWSHVPSAMRKEILEYYQFMENFSAILVRILEKELSLPEDYLISFMDKHTSILSVNYYPLLDIKALEESDPSTPTERVAEHTDVSMFTIVSEAFSPHSNTCLQLWNRQSNSWNNASLPPGYFLVNVGDYLENISGGRFHSVKHRVVSTTNQAPPNERMQCRISTAYFCTPNFDAQIDLSTSDNSSLVGALNYDVWRKKRIALAMEKMKRTNKK